MRAVNLIPPQERRVGGQVASLPYAVVGGLVLVLIGVVAVILTNNKISDREADVARLEQEEQAAREKADALQSFANFSTMKEARTATVSSLAQSRFDWERVIRELALVIPSDVWLVNVTGTVLPDVQVDKAAETETRDTVNGPAVEIVGCAPSQDAVARFAAALEDIDGVTRVGVESAEKPEQEVEESAGGAGAEGGASTDDCRTRNFISRFEIVVAFDAAPVPVAAAAAPTAPAASAAAPAAPAASAVPTTPAEPTADQQGSVEQQTSKAENAANLIPGR